MNSALDVAKRTSVYLVAFEDNVDREFLQIISTLQVFKPINFDNTLATQANNPY